MSEREICICAAVRLRDGTVIRGHRHTDALRTAHELVEWRLGKGAWEAEERARLDQGFVTSRNRYVGREEGLKLQHEAGIPSACKSGYRVSHLFSEDLY